MRKRLCTVLIIMSSLLLCACTDLTLGNEVATDEPQDTRDTVETVTDSATEEPVGPTEPLHSELYLPQYSVDQIITYFDEIVLNTEFSDGTGDATLIQKWIEPLRYRIYGNPTEKDLEILTELFSQLNEINGFPGICAAEEGEYSNLTISFLDPDAFSAEFSEVINGEDAYGAVQFWYYTATNEIYDAKIGYRTDIDQDTRISVLLEEIVNVLGTSDTVLREDSIVYQYSNDNLALSDVDQIILKLLYDPEIKCGMNADRCGEIIRELYY